METKSVVNRRYHLYVPSLSRDCALMTETGREYLRSEHSERQRRRDTVGQAYTRALDPAAREHIYAALAEIGADVPEGLAECSQCGRVGLPGRVRERDCRLRVSGYTQTPRRRPGSVHSHRELHTASGFVVARIRECVLRFAEIPTTIQKIPSLI